MRRFLSSLAVLGFLGILLSPAAAFAAQYGCCIIPTEGRVGAASPSHVETCMTVNSLPACTKYASDHSRAYNWQDKPCSSVDLCSGRAPQNCCKTVRTAGAATRVTACTAVPDAGACTSIADAEQKRAGSTGFSYNGQFVSGSCIQIEDCKGVRVDYGFAGGGSESGGTGTIVAGEAEVPFVTPALQVTIPTVSFSELVVESGGGQSYIDVPYIALYIQGIYHYVLGAVAALAIAMIVWGGVKWLTAGGATEQVSSAKTTITNAIVGMLIAMGSFLILYTINPKLLDLRPIRVPIVSRLLFDVESSFMNDEVGFKDPDKDAAREAEMKADQGAANAGTADFISYDDVGGAGVDISAIKAKTQGLGASEKLREYCSSPDAVAKMETYEDKITALVRVVLGFNEVCIQSCPTTGYGKRKLKICDSGCVYVRGGSTELSSGTVSVGANDTPFILNHFSARGVSRDKLWRADCEQDYVALGGGDVKKATQAFYSARWKPEGAKFNYKTSKQQGSGSCHDALNLDYKLAMADPLTTNKSFGSDCGGTAVAMYSCAGGKASPPLQAYTSGGIAGRTQSHIVYAGKDYQDVMDQIRASGGLKFGDVVIAGSGNKNHIFMWTGGRDDVPFNWIEMGGGPGADGTVGAKGRIPNGAYYDINRPQTTQSLPGTVGGGMQVRGKDDPWDYWNKKYWYPIYIVRPYQYTKCESRSECSSGQVCGCATSDYSKGQKINYDSCSMKNVCHKAKAGIYCNTDENCPNGTSCKKHACT